MTDASAPAAGAATGTDYSDAFGRFFTHENDIEGALAYALYKQQKREFIVRNRLPLDHERVRQYHCDLNDARIGQLREVAAKRLDAVNDFIVAKTTEELESEVAAGFISDELNEQAGRIAELFKLTEKTNQNVLSGTAWWRSVVAGVAASFVFGLVLTWAKVIDWTNPLPTNPPAQNSPQEQRQPAE